eukprot:m.710506 g.710506  ORF g.710506 m.710506 type:complete len:205 (-) comp58760_c0_seq9:2529-3143(-)
MSLWWLQMGEVVQERLELQLDELHHLYRAAIFTRQQIRDIVKRRKMFEYALKKRTTPLGDYLRYIQYELNLEHQRRQRKLELNITQRGASDFSIIKRVHNIFAVIPALPLSFLLLSPLTLLLAQEMMFLLTRSTPSLSFWSFPFPSCSLSPSLPLSLSHMGDRKRLRSSRAMCRCGSSTSSSASTPKRARRSRAPSQPQSSTTL